MNKCHCSSVFSIVQKSFWNFKRTMWFYSKNFGVTFVPQVESVYVIPYTIEGHKYFLFHHYFHCLEWGCAPQICHATYRFKSSIMTTFLTGLFLVISWWFIIKTCQLKHQIDLTWFQSFARSTKKIQFHDYIQVRNYFDNQI